MKSPEPRKSYRITGIVREGKPVVDDPGLLKLALLQLEGKRFEYEMVPEGERRTAAQNRRWWGVLVPLMRQYLGKQEGREMSPREAHHTAVYAFLGRHTSKGSTRQEFAYLMNQTELYLGERGYMIPAYADHLDNGEPVPEGVED
jgi:hypothetical protein